jgi:S-methyl-5-thioribose-1-phosphate isomerase
MSAAMPRAAVAWAGGAIEVVDQTRLPREEVVLRLRTPQEAIGAIRRLAVRGAPAIGVCGALAVVLAADELGERADPAALAAAAEPVATARPTAVNLRWAVDRVVRAVRGARSPAELRARALAEAQAVLEEDREACEAIARHGAAELAGASRLMTICNTGRLATAGWGTALGIVYAKARAGAPVEVLACETRPLLQGARLTAWELRDAGIPVTVLTEGAAPLALAQGRADAVVVGCDRVARNGDVANKVGTLVLALAARAAGVPFYVAGPRSTFDPGTATGAEIEIEERDGDEVRAASGLPADVAVWNPAFDVVPASLVTAFVCEDGVLRPPFAPAIAGLARPGGALAA